MSQNGNQAALPEGHCDLHSQVGEWRPRFATCLSSTAEYGFVESHLCDECFCIAKHFSDPFRGIWQALKSLFTIFLPFIPKVRKLDA
jgi:hypothetical protein